MKCKNSLFFSLLLILIPVVILPTSANGTGSIYISDCGYDYEIKPKSISLACADGYVGIMNIKWKSWGGARAAASGTYYYNNCNPNCASGKLIKFKMTFEVGSIWREKKSGKNVYSQLQTLDSGNKQLADQSYGNLYDLTVKSGKPAGPRVNPGAGSPKD